MDAPIEQPGQTPLDLPLYGSDDSPVYVKGGRTLPVDSQDIEVLGGVLYKGAAESQVVEGVVVDGRAGHDGGRQYEPCNQWQQAPPIGQAALEYEPGRRGEPFHPAPKSPTQCGREGDGLLPKVAEARPAGDGFPPSRERRK